MISKPIDELLQQSRVLAPRAGTDRFFPLPAGSFDLHGPIDEAARFIESYQLLNAPLFSKFVRVFTEEPRLDSKNLGWRGEYWGKMMRGGCITYAYTQNKELLAVLTATAREMMQAAEPDGRISSYDRAAELDGWDVWCRKYVMLGLEYFLEICPDEALAKEILATVRREADCLMAAVGNGAAQKDITRTARIWAGMASSSVLEPIMRLYFLTGEGRYLDFATYIVERGGNSLQNTFLTALEDRIPLHRQKVLKAYETMSCFEGLLEYYRATGVEKWRTAAINFAKRLRAEEETLIGSLGCWHELFDHAATRQLTTTYADVMQETCVTVTYLKFSLQMLCLTGDAAIADSMERAAYNALLGAVNFEKDTKNGGLPFDSYSPLIMGARGRYVGGKQTLSDGSFYGCCACIGAAGTGLVPQAAALLSPDGLLLNFYLPGTIATKAPSGAPLELELDTDYPQSGRVCIRVSTLEEAPFVISLRIPSWSRRTVLAVNGMLYDATPGTFTRLHRTWRTGDTIELWLDMRTELLTPPETDLPDENARYHVAFRRGPLILARDSRLPGDFRAPVCPRESEAGYADVRLAEKPEFRAFWSFAAKQKDGSELPLVDYASAGHTFDCHSLVSAWMPTKNYYKTDPGKPFCLRACSWKRGNTPGIETRAPLFVEEHVLKIAKSSENEPVFTPIPQQDGTCLLRVEDQYVFVNEEGVCTLSEEGTHLRLVYEGLNRYHMELPDGRALAIGKAPAKGARAPIVARALPIVPVHLFELWNPYDKG